MTRFFTRAALSGALVLAAVGTAAETVRLNTQEWAPYQTEENGQVSGIAVRAVRCMIGAMGHEAEIAVMPWARAQKDVADGLADGFFAASRNSARDAYAELSRPFIPQVWRWYSLTRKNVDTAGKATRIGVVAGSSMESWLIDNGYAGIQRSQSTASLVRMLQIGRIDAVLANELVFRRALNDLGVSEDAFTSTPHSDHPLGVYFGKTFLAAHPGFMDAFNAQIGNCR